MGTSIEPGLFVAVLSMEDSVWPEFNMLPQFLCLFGARVFDKRHSCCCPAFLCGKDIKEDKTYPTAVVFPGQSV